MFSLPCELLWRLGLSPYTVYVRFLLVMTWLVAWIYFLLLATQIISPVSELAYMITTGFFIALMLLLKGELEMRQADIVKLAAMPAEAHRMANQLPEELHSLRPVVDSFGASAQPAVVLTQQALAVVQRTFDRLDRLVRPRGQRLVQAERAPAGYSTAVLHWQAQQAAGARVLRPALASFV